MRFVSNTKNYLGTPKTETTVSKTEKFHCVGAVEDTSS